MQILNGIYLVNGSPYGRHQNGYLVCRNGATVMIDSGDLEDAETLSEVERNAQRWGFSFSQVSHLFITHAHFDHASHAAHLQRRGIKIVASPATAEAMSAGDARCIGYAVQRQFEPCQVDEVIHDGKVFFVGDLAVRCHAAPGHCDGLVVYEMELDSELSWFTGDLFEAQHAHAWINLPWTGALDFNKATYITSLTRLLEHKPCDHILPGHGPAAIGNGYRLLQMAYNQALVEWR
ncbi:MAG: MBL fold metallo-hydrolase [Anaerolineae bacterium]|nr:MBL fold metallo-hydrolase [Anaerolineae bacterium]